MQEEKGTREDDEMDGNTNSMDVTLSKLLEMGEGQGSLPGMLQSMGSQSLFFFQDESLGHRGSLSSLFCLGF